MDTSYAKWGLWDVFKWKIFPEKYGGGKQYIQHFKDGWVVYNKSKIINTANEYGIPPTLLASVAWIEVGGDPDFIDHFAFQVRAFDWSGPSWVDKHLTITNNPSKTSFGPISIQLRVAAETIGLNPKNLTYQQQTLLIDLLNSDVWNLKVVAKHLAFLIKHDFPTISGKELTDEQIRIVGARYNRGIGLNLEQLKQNTSYGNFILKNMARIEPLLNNSVP